MASVKLWDGTTLRSGSVKVWNGTALVPGQIRLWPWTDVGDGSLTGVTIIDGTNPANVTFAVGISGGAPDTVYTSLDTINGGTP